MRVLTIIPQNEQAQPWNGCLCQVLGTFFLLPDEQPKLPGGASRKPRVVGLEIRKWPAANCKLPVDTICIGIWEVSCCELESIIVICCYILGSQPAQRYQDTEKIALCQYPASSCPMVAFKRSAANNSFKSSLLKMENSHVINCDGIHTYIMNIFKNHEP